MIPLQDPKFLPALMDSYSLKIQDFIDGAGYDVPESVRLCFGKVPWDTAPMLAVNCSRVFNSNPGIRPDLTRLNPKGARNPAVTLTATVLHNMLTLPGSRAGLAGPDPLDQEARDFYAEAWAVWWNVDNDLAHGQLFTESAAPGWSNPIGNTVIPNDLVILEPQGGVAGYAVSVVVSLGN